MVKWISGPMAYTSNILLGRITKVSGYEGTVAVKLEKSSSENIPEMETVFLEIEGKLVPFFISESEYSGAGILKLRFEGYGSIEKAREFTGCRVFLTSGIQDADREEEIGNLAGFRVMIHEDIFLGIISEVIMNPAQWLIRIITAGNKEILIPFHEDFIVSIDKDSKIILMELPEGLTDLN